MKNNSPLLVPSIFLALSSAALAQQTTQDPSLGEAKKVLHALEADLQCSPAYAQPTKATQKRVEGIQTFLNTPRARLSLELMERDYNQYLHEGFSNGFATPATAVWKEEVDRRGATNLSILLKRLRTAGRIRTLSWEMGMKNSITDSTTPPVLPLVEGFSLLPLGDDTSAQASVNFSKNGTWVGILDTSFYNVEPTHSPTMIQMAFVREVFTLRAKPINKFTGVTLELEYKRFEKKLSAGVSPSTAERFKSTRRLEESDLEIVQSELMESLVLNSQGEITGPGCQFPFTEDEYVPDYFGNVYFPGLPPNVENSSDIKRILARKIEEQKDRIAQIEQKVVVEGPHQRDISHDDPLEVQSQLRERR